MLTIAVAVLVAISTWWISTGLILVLNGLPRRTYPASLAAATGLLGAALLGVSSLRTDASSAGACLGFGCGIAAWGWLEMSFLMGFLTGPRRRPCHGSCHGWRHFLHAVQAILYHEIAILTLGVLVAALSWHAANTVAAQTIVILWAMQASAKLNLFFGVRNLSAELLPADMAYLGSFFRQRSMNFLFPVSITAGTLLVGHFINNLRAGGLSEFGLTANALLATLAVLGVLEHWMLVLPFQPMALWNWGLRGRQPQNA